MCGWSASNGRASEGGRVRVAVWCESPTQWPSMSLPSQLLVISTSPPHTQVALTRAVKAAHTNRLERIEWDDGCLKRCQPKVTHKGVKTLPGDGLRVCNSASIRFQRRGRRTARRAGRRLRPPSTAGTSSPPPPFGLRAKALCECDCALCFGAGRAGPLCFFPTQSARRRAGPAKSSAAGERQPTLFSSSSQTADLRTESSFGESHHHPPTITLRHGLSVRLRGTHVPTHPPPAPTHATHPATHGVPQTCRPRSRHRHTAHAADDKVTALNFRRGAGTNRMWVPTPGIV